MGGLSGSPIAFLIFVKLKRHLFFFYLRSLPLVVCVYAFGAQTKIFAQNLRAVLPA